MIWVVEKPTGFSTYSSSPKDPGWKEYVEQNQNQRLYPIHRLDRDTSGIVVFALDPKSAAIFGQLLNTREVKKVYLAIVDGEVPHEGEIKFPLPKREGGKESAWTLFRRKKFFPYRGKPASLVEVLLMTGRFHQIRRHFQMLGNSVLGDKEAGTEDRAARLMLHSWRLEFMHPKNGKRVRLQCPPPKEFKF